MSGWWSSTSARSATRLTKPIAARKSGKRNFFSIVFPLSCHPASTGSRREISSGESSAAIVAPSYRGALAATRRGGSAARRPRERFRADPSLPLTDGLSRLDRRLAGVVPTLDAVGHHAHVGVASFGRPPGGLVRGHSMCVRAVENELGILRRRKILGDVEALGRG